MMKKMLTSAAMLSLVFILTFTSIGCQKKDDTPAQDNEGQVEQQSGKTAKQEEPIIIKWYTPSDNETNKGYKYPEVVEAFEKENPGIKVELRALVPSNNNDDYLKKVDLMIASGEQIDFFNFPNPAHIPAKVKAGALEPMDEYAKKAGIDLEEEYRGVMRVDEKIYSIPSSFSMWVVVMNKEMLDEAGLPVPPNDWTWDDYREYAKKLTKGEGKDKVYGSYFHTWEWFNAIGYMNKIEDSPWYKADGSANFDHPVFKQFMEYRHELENVDKTQMALSDIKTQKIAYRSIFFGGKAAMMPMGTWILSDIGNTELFPHTFETTFAALPRADETCTPNFTANGNAGAGYAMNAKSQYKEETFQFLRFLTTEGMDISKGWFSPWKKGDVEAFAKQMMGDDESLYDFDAFKNVVLDPNVKFNIYKTQPSYGVEIINIFNEESEKYFFGAQTVDEAIANMQKRANDVINKNK